MLIPTEKKPKKNTYKATKVLDNQEIALDWYVSVHYSHQNIRNLSEPSQITYKENLTRFFNYSVSATRK